MKLPLLISTFSTMSFLCVNANLEDIFTQAYNDSISGKFGEIESASGPGSTLEQTKNVRSFIKKVVQDFAITSIVDAPCGDFYWMKHVDIGICTYTGIDVVKPLIYKNNELYQSTHIEFLAQDVLADAIPCADLIICRDFLVHLSHADVKKALRNFKASGAKYLLTTTFPLRRDCDIQSGGWRPINLEAAPFYFPRPLILSSEECTEQNGAYADKSLALWKLDDIKI